MKLAKEYIDVGVRTNRLNEMLDFWTNTVGLKYDHLLKVGNGVHQHRLDLNGSVFKLNHTRAPLAESTPTGYSSLYINADVSEAQNLTDPDGNLVILTPDVSHIGIGMTVRSLPDAARFYTTTLQGEALSENRFRLGTTEFIVHEDPARPPSGGMQGTGYRYLTIQVWKVDDEHAGLIARGAIEASPPVTLGKTARISFVTDPDGNWIEISQRASLTGDLGAN